jgi:carnosine N-methyltransferase
LVAGDFEEIYGSDEHDPDEPQAGEWNAIVTCFFIDTVSDASLYHGGALLIPMYERPKIL